MTLDIVILVASTKAACSLPGGFVTEQRP